MCEGLWIKALAIQLCTKAEEVQAQWNPKHGNFFLGENKRIECWVEKVHAGRQVHKGFGIRHKDSTVIYVIPYVWLPRLDQLMELAQVTGRRFESVSQEFFVQCRHGKVWDGAHCVLAADL